MWWRWIRMFLPRWRKGSSRSHSSYKNCKLGIPFHQSKPNSQMPCQKPKDVVAVVLRISNRDGNLDLYIGVVEMSTRLGKSLQFWSDLFGDGKVDSALSIMLKLHRWKTRHYCRSMTLIKMATWISSLSKYGPREDYGASPKKLTVDQLRENGQFQRWNLSPIRAKYRFWEWSRPSLWTKPKRRWSDSN